MLVDLNTKAFENAKHGDVFVIEENNGKKYAKPISKEVFLRNINERLEKSELKLIETENKIKELETNLNNKLIKIAKLVGGSNNEKN